MMSIEYSANGVEPRFTAGSMLDQCAIWPRRIRLTPTHVATLAKTPVRAQRVRRAGGGGGRHHPGSSLRRRGGGCPKEAQEAFR